LTSRVHNFIQIGRKV